MSTDMAWEFRQARQDLEYGWRGAEAIFADLQAQIQMHALSLEDRLDTFEDRLRGKS